MVCRRAPRARTKKERAEHEVTHIPFRDWCESCIAGRARTRPHRSLAQAKVNWVHFDYFFGGDDAKAHPHDCVPG